MRNNGSTMFDNPRLHGEPDKKRKKEFNPYSRPAKIIRFVVVVIFTLYAIALMYPYLYAFDISLMKNGRAFINNPVHIPWPMYFSNYAKAFKELEVNGCGYFRMVFNSLWYSTLSPALGLISSTCTGYVVCRYEFRGKKLIYNGVLLTMMIPVMGTLTATYKLYYAMHLVNSPLILVTSMGGFGGTFLYVYSFFKSTPREYTEAARIDGAGHFCTFLKVNVPLVMPLILTFFVMGFVGCWNDYNTSLMWFPKMPTLAYGIYEYEGIAEYSANQPVFFAGTIMAIIPVVALFLAFQNAIMNNVTIGGLKG